MLSQSATATDLTIAALAVSGTPFITEAAEDVFGLWLLTVQFACDGVDEALIFCDLWGWYFVSDSAVWAN